jgi:hypothetical protein
MSRVGPTVPGGRGTEFRVGPTVPGGQGTEFRVGPTVPGGQEPRPGRTRPRVRETQTERQRGRRGLESPRSCVRRLPCDHFLSRISNGF